MGIKNKNLIDMIRRNNDYFEDYVTRSVYHSNAIEGNTLSYYETYQIIFKCSSEEILSNVKPRELYEAINLKYAMDYIFNHIEEDVTASFLIDIGKIINKNISEIPRWEWSLRTCFNE
jgi:Fic family protein